MTMTYSIVCTADTMVIYALHSHHCFQYSVFETKVGM